MRLKLASLSATLGFSALMLALSSGEAHAYLDAGTGSMLLQILLGGFAGLAIAGKLYWHRLLTAIGLRREPADDKPASEDAARTLEGTSR